MPKPLRISFIWDWTPEYYQSVTWQDGLARALKELGIRGHVIQILCAGDVRNTIKNPYFDIAVSTDIPADVKEFNPDVILHWADLTRPNARSTSRLGKPMAICFAGGETMGENLPYFAHFFVESEVYFSAFEGYGRSVSTAFGTNTELFRPAPDQAKIFDALMVGTFARWKRHELFAAATKGLTACAAGYMYDDHEQDCWQVCEAAGNLVLPHLSAPALQRLYASAKCVVIPSLSSGGSQRTVLEVMAMNIPLIITDSDKFDYAQDGRAYKVEPNIRSIREQIDAILDKGEEANTRDYIVNNWSHICYADAIERGLYSIC